MGSASGKKLGKSDYIRRHPHLKSTELIALAKTEGISLSRQLIFAARKRTGVHAMGPERIARIIGVSSSAVRRWIDQGFLPGRRTDQGRRRVERSALRRFLHEYGMPIPSSIEIQRVLIIDDAKSARRAQRLLSEHTPPLTVRTVRGLADASRMIGTFRPDAVLVDATVAGANAMDFCRHLRTNLETEHIAVLAMSGRTTRKLEAQLAEAGFEGVLSKPVDATRLFDALGLWSARAAPT